MRITTETRESCEIYDVLLWYWRSDSGVKSKREAIYFLHLTPNYVRQVVS